LQFLSFVLFLSTVGSVVHIDGISVRLASMDSALSPEVRSQAFIHEVFSTDGQQDSNENIYLRVIDTNMGSC